MKAISNLMRIIGGMMIVGTAGSADHVMIGFSEAVSGALSGIFLIALAALLPHLWKGFRYIALAIFCIR